MSAFQKGDTYFGPLKRSTSIPHLWFIISNPDPKTGVFVVVNMTDFENNQGDTTCVLNPGEHPRITKRSVINYDDTSAVTESQLQHFESGGFLIKQEPASESLLNRIQQGALVSDDMDPRLARLVKYNR